MEIKMRCQTQHNNFQKTIKLHVDGNKIELIKTLN